MLRQEMKLYLLKELFVQTTKTNSTDDERGGKGAHKPTRLSATWPKILFILNLLCIAGSHEQNKNDPNKI